MIVLKKIIDIDPVIKLLIFCLLFYFLSNLNIQSNYQISDQNNQYIYIEIEKEGNFPLVHQININNLSSNPLPPSLIDSQITNGKKYYLDKNNKVYKISQIAGKHKIALGIPLNINTAGLHDLMALPGIGQITAQRILDHRKSRGKFNNKQELMEVKRIGPKTYNKIEKYLTY